MTAAKLAILTPDETNTRRQPEIDLVRVLAILTMVCIHLFEVMPFYPAMLATWPPLYLIMEFLGGPLSAPLFMSAMGIGIAYAHAHDPAALARRGMHLILQGYLLNVLRAGLPLLIAYDLTQNPDTPLFIVEKLLELDILQFAGLTFLALALVGKMGLGPIQTLAVAVALEAIATFVRPFAGNLLTVRATAGFFLYQNELTAFPLFSWLIYPAAGVCFGHLLRRVQAKGRFYARVFAAALAAYVLLTALYTALGMDIRAFFADDDLYYAQGLLVASWILPICAMSCAAMYPISQAFARASALAGLCTRISSHVNDVYITQWVIIGWLEVLVLPHIAVSVPWYFVLAAAITVASIALGLARHTKKAG